MKTRQERIDHWAGLAMQAIVTAFEGDSDADRCYDIAELMEEERQVRYPELYKKPEKLEKQDPKGPTVAQKFARAILPMLALPSEHDEGILCRQYNTLKKSYGVDEIRTVYKTAKAQSVIFNSPDHVMGWFQNALKNLHRKQVESERKFEGADTDAEKFGGR